MTDMKDPIERLRRAEKDGRMIDPTGIADALEARDRQVRDAEREKCANIAHEFGKEVDPQDGSYIRHQNVTGDRISAAIRKG